MEQLPDVKINKLIKLKAKRLAEYIQKRDSITWEKAVEKMVSTKTYDCLIDKKTEYYSESDEYIANQYELELVGNWEEWMKL